MKVILRLFFIILLILAKFACFSLHCQPQLGWGLDPHAGISGALVQPAATSATPYKWDINLFSFNLSARSDYLFIQNASVRELGLAVLTNGAPSFNRSGLLFRIGTTDYTYAYANSTGRPHVAQLGIDILGPSGSIQLGEFSRIGAFTRIRTALGSRSIDEDLNFFTYEELVEGTTFALDEFYAGVALWSELGLNFSHAMYVGDEGELRIGGNFRYLLGHEGGSFYNPDGAQLRKIGGDSIIVINADTEIAVSEGLLSNSFSSGVTGGGIGLDLGLQYAWGYSAAGGYRYVIGLSVLDIGAVPFRQGAQQHRFTNGGEVLLDAEDYPFVGDDGFGVALNQLSRDTYDGDSNNSLRASEFEVGLPTAISAQFAFKPFTPLQISLAYRGDFPLASRRLTQGEQLTVAAHYSKHWYGAGFTASLYDWNTHNFGFQLRGGPFYFGTDLIRGTITTLPELNSGGFYFGIRLHEFKRKGQANNTRTSLPKNGSKPVKCYKF
ncbi:MAG: hypothetical protein AAGA31_01730 [Bacteroidota bacterium]